MKHLCIYGSEKLLKWELSVPPGVGGVESAAESAADFFICTQASRKMEWLGT